MQPDGASFGAWLRQHRERKKVSIASIAESTKILAALLEGLEHGEVARWPSGLYRRAFIRAYAGAIGLDPEPVVREFLEHFPDPEELNASPATAPPPGGTRAPWAVLRLTLDTGSSGGTTLAQKARHRLLAVLFDAFVLSVAGLSMFLAIGSLWWPMTLALTVYFFGGVLILGTTPGLCLMTSIDRADARARTMARTRQARNESESTARTTLGTRLVDAVMSLQSSLVGRTDLKGQGHATEAAAAAADPGLKLR